MKLNLKCLKGDPANKNVTLLAGYNDQTAAYKARHKSEFVRIEATIEATDQKGKLPLWSGYRETETPGHDFGPNARRKMSQVRTGRASCIFYAWLVAQKQPDIVLEFGAAFGASGMYWLAGLEQTGKGTLFSYEPNPDWCPHARSNFQTVSDRFVLTQGTFEENRHLIPAPVDIALIDAIHTQDFVMEQFRLVREVAAPGAIVIFDDINFSDDMADCWSRVAAMADLATVWQIGERVGLVELP